MNKLEEFHKRNVIRDIKSILKSYEKDPIEQLGQYLTWAVGTKYLIELRICWELQGFDDESWFEIVRLSLKLTKQEYDETQREVDKFRKSKDYDKFMEDVEEEMNFANRGKKCQRITN